jgi:hypothetical protein
MDIRKNARPILLSVVNPNWYVARLSWVVATGFGCQKAVRKAHFQRKAKSIYQTAAHGLTICGNQWPQTAASDTTATADGP